MSCTRPPSLPFDAHTVDWYMEFACSEAIPYKGRNKEYALHVLQEVNYNIKVGRWDGKRGIWWGRRERRGSCWC